MDGAVGGGTVLPGLDRKSTRLNSSHEWISYAVFCLKKKIHTSVPAEHLEPTADVTAYKQLSTVERDFLSFKNFDLDLRPVHHRLEVLFFFFNDTATTEIYTLSLHDALPI